MLWLGDEDGLAMRDAYSTERAEVEALGAVLADAEVTAGPEGDLLRRGEADGALHRLVGRCERGFRGFAPQPAERRRLRMRRRKYRSLSLSRVCFVGK